MDKTVVVTGGTRGIGAAMAQAFHKQGWRVAAVYHKGVERAQAFSQETSIPVFSFDVSRAEACAEGIAHIEAHVGPVDALVNNAGITQDAMLHKMSVEQWDQVITTNLSSAFYLCRCVIPGMRARKWGRIINISSVNGQKGQRGQTNYAAAKAGLLGFSKALALETAPYGITVNAIAPGYIDTEMVQAVPPEVLEKIQAGIPLGRLGRAEEVAQMALYLVGPEASFVTGAVMNLNGGQFMG